MLHLDWKPELFLCRKKRCGFLASVEQDGICSPCQPTLPILQQSTNRPVTQGANMTLCCVIRPLPLGENGTAGVFIDYARRQCRGLDCHKTLFPQTTAVSCDITAVMVS